MATTPETSSKAEAAYRNIGEVAELLDLPQHVLRFWETKFTVVKPLKRAGGRRFYGPQDIELLTELKNLLYQQGYTIKGVQRLLRGARGVSSALDLARKHRDVAPAPEQPASEGAVDADGEVAFLKEMLGALRGLQADLARLGK